MRISIVIESNDGSVEHVHIPMNGNGQVQEVLAEQLPKELPQEDLRTAMLKILEERGPLSSRQVREYLPKRLLKEGEKCAAKTLAAMAKMGKLKTSGKKGARVYQLK